MKPSAPPNFSGATQRALFQASNVIPFKPSVPPPPAKPRTRTAQRKVSKIVEGQGTLDFLPSAPVKPRTLGTTVDSVIYCEAPVATTLHRAVAAALDWSMVLIAYGLFLATYYLCGGEFYLSNANLMVFGGALLAIAVTYGMFFTIANTETAGMHWTHLRLTTFDGDRPDLRHRVIRFAGSCLSICTVVGVLWSLVDEESLTWQDHISGTFPTPRLLDSQIFRRV
jgi:uncharacterized RDD family membrane protein YckC